MSTDAFFDFFMHELRKVYDIEKHLVKALPKIARAADSDELKMAFEEHWEETKEQVNRLKQIYSILNERPHERSLPDSVIQKMLDEGDVIIHAFPASPLRDAALIAAAQCIEHYEITLYGTLRTFAKQLELEGIADLLQYSLNEEGNANKLLTKIAEGGFFTSGVNLNAIKY